MNNNIPLTAKFIHALRSELTILNFEESHNNKLAGINKVANLIDRFEIYSNCNDGYNIDRVQVVDIRELINQVIADNFEDQKRRLYFSPKLINVYGNRLELRYLVRELLKNALAYSLKTVFISLHKTETKAILRVEDFGKGLSVGIAKSIPNPFLASANPQSGHGLGLAIIKSVVDANKGLLKIVSEKGGGTTMIISLNLVENFDVGTKRIKSLS